MEFEPFSIAHVLGIAMGVLFVIIMVIFRRRLREPRINRLTRIAIAGILFSCEFSLHVWYAVTSNYGLYSLPFQLCSIMMWLSIVLLLNRNHKLYEITFFLGILGAVQALLTPNLDVTFPTFRYFHFFIAHGAIIAASVFFTVIDGYRPRAASVLRALGWLHVLAIPAAITNFLTGSNFMFLARKPETASLLDLLAPWPWYLLQLELVALIFCWALLFFVKGLDRMVRNL